MYCRHILKPELGLTIFPYNLQIKLSWTNVWETIKEVIEKDYGNDEECSS